MDQRTGAGARPFRRGSRRAGFFMNNSFPAGAGVPLVVIPVFMGIVAVQTFVFALLHHTGQSLALFSLLPGLFLGVAILILEYLLALLKGWMSERLDRIVAGFLLFFTHVIGYISLFSLLVSYPVGIFMEIAWGVTALGEEYGLFSVNFALVLSILSWIRNLRRTSEMFSRNVK